MARTAGPVINSEGELYYRNRLVGGIGYTAPDDEDVINGDTEAGWWWMLDGPGMNELETGYATLPEAETAMRICWRDLAEVRKYEQAKERAARIRVVSIPAGGQGGWRR
ncbi:hypothetical protein [Streptomyces daqingensis]|nr:hypothetical protein [Streptomyces daqingensis]